MACEWKGTLQRSMHEITPEAIDKLSGWWKTVEAECAAIEAPVGAGESDTATEGAVANPVKQFFKKWSWLGKALAFIRMLVATVVQVVKWFHG